MSEAQEILRGLLEDFKAIDAERLKETDEAHAEAAKWKAEGDMYGWNFHEGKAGGITIASIMFDRLRRKMEAAIKEAEQP